MRRDWGDPYSLEARPNHCATESEQEDFEEAIEELGMIAAHIGANLDVHASFRLPRKRKRKVAP